MGRGEHRGRYAIAIQRYPKLNPDRDYFKLPNCLFLLGLSAGEIAVYSYLLRCEDRENFTCYPSFRTIGKAVGLSKNTVQKYVNALERKGLIETRATKVHTRTGKTRNGNLLFTILPIQSALELHNERQMFAAESPVSASLSQR